MTLKCGANGQKGDRPVDDALANELGGRLWPSPMDLSLFPFDKQRCEIVMASWFYPGRDVNLTMMSKGNPFSTSIAADPEDGMESKSTEFIVHPVKVERIERFYTCCPGEPFPTLHFYLTFERYYVDYVINILVPALVTVACGFLAFFIPPEFGERIGLGITCVLTVMAVMFITTDSLPATSNVTLLALYYVGALIFTVLPLGVSCLVGYLTALSLRSEGAKNSSAEVLDMLWDLTEEVVTEEAEVRERSKFLGEKLGNYFMSQLGTDLAHRELVHKAAKNQAKLQERSVKSMDGVDEGGGEGGGGNRGGKESDGAATASKPDKSWSSAMSFKSMEATRSMRVRSFKNRFEIKMHMISPTYDVMADMINRVTGQVWIRSILTTPQTY